MQSLYTVFYNTLYEYMFWNTLPREPKKKNARYLSNIHFVPKLFPLSILISNGLTFCELATLKKRIASAKALHIKSHNISRNT